MSGTTGGSDGSVEPQEYFAWALERDDRDRADADDPPPGIAEDLDLVERLRELGTGSPRHEPDTPTDLERARMRARILGELPEPAPRARAAEPHRALAPASPGPGRHRLLRGVLAAAVCLLIAVSGASLLFSGGALPGDPLYGIKRTVEHASLALSFGEKSTGLTHLELAGHRVDEIRSLLAAEPSAPATVYVRALRALDADAAAGSRALTDVGTDTAGSTLESLRRWSSRQYRRLTAVTADLPPAAVPASRSSATLLDRIVRRAEALRHRFPCRAITSGRSDELGPLPATGACRETPRTVDPYAATTPLPPKPPRPSAPPPTTAPAPAPDPAPQDTRMLAEPRVTPRRAVDAAKPAAPLPARVPARVPVAHAPAAPRLDLPLPGDLGSVTVPGVVSLGLG